MRVLRFLLRKEFLQIFRDKLILTMLFTMPIVQLLVLSNAATFEVKTGRVYFVDHDHTTMSRGIADRMAASGRFRIAESSQSIERADEAMLDRRVDLILVVPADFEREVVRTRSGSVQLIMNAEDGAAAGVMQSYAARILAGYARELAVELNPGLATMAERGGPVDGVARIEVRQRGLYNSELEYSHYMVPGILVVLVTMVGTLMTAVNIVREKESGTLDQLNVTPISRSTFIAAKLIPLWTLAMLDLLIGLVIARYVFGVPVRGNPAVVFIAAAVYLTAALGIGLWVSTIAETQQQAMFVTVSILLVYLLMSGIFTPVRGMPQWAQVISQASPVTHFTRLMRAVLLKGAGFREVSYEFLMLSVIGGTVLTFAVRQYSKRTA